MHTQTFTALCQTLESTEGLVFLTANKPNAEVCEKLEWLAFPCLCSSSRTNTGHLSPSDAKKARSASKSKSHSVRTDHRSKI